MKISVIVPVYNTAPYLKKCLESLLAQTWPDFEILAVNDGSTDESTRILAEYAEKYPERIRVFTKENGGLSDARNFGIARAAGQALAFVDSDDYVSPFFLEYLAQPLLAGQDLALCHPVLEYENGKTVPVPSHRGLSRDPVREYLLSEPMACTRLIRAGLFSGLRFPRGTWYEDLALCPLLALRTEKIAFVDKGLYVYVQRSGSIMNQKRFDPRMRDIFTVLEGLERAFAGRGMEREVEYLFIEHLLHSAALTFAPLPEAKALFRELREKMRPYPRWKENPYFRRRGRKFRLVAALAGGGHFRLLRVLKKLKG